jgi:hypothetical protein
MMINANNHAGDNQMDEYRNTAKLVGILYLVATAAGLIGLGLFMDPILSAPDYLAKVSALGNQVLISVLLELLMAVAVACIGIVIYPVLRKYDAVTAIGYFGARIVEPMIYLINAISLLTLLTLSQEFVRAGAPDVSYFQTLGELLRAVPDWAGHVVLDVAVFPLGALIFNLLLYKAKLIPTWLSGWGFVGAILYWIPGVLIMFSLISPLSTTQVLLQAPLGLQEIVFAIWLIMRGFNATAVKPASAG